VVECQPEVLEWRSGSFLLNLTTAWQPIFNGKVGKFGLLSFIHHSGILK